MKRFSDKWLSNNNIFKQTIGALCKSNWNIAFFSCAIILISIYTLKVCGIINNNIPIIAIKICLGFSYTCIFGCISYIVSKLNNIFSLRKQETRITWNQIIFLACFALYLIALVSLIEVKKESSSYMLLSATGLVLGWIFQDTIKSVVAFFYLRANGLLNIGDWIEVPSHKIDGMVKTISLTTVTIENWDTTTSAFPTYILHSENFINNQRMMEGKTLGRMMQKTFILDTGWFHPLTEEDCNRLKKELDVDAYFKEQVIKCNLLNAEIFRQYIYHWLMNHTHVSQEPRLIVRWLEQTNEGMPLQLYIFITDTTLAPYEWQQSLIIEHFIKSLTMFDLQLFQTPSGYDASNSNIYMSNEEAKYKKNHSESPSLS